MPLTAHQARQEALKRADQKGLFEKVNQEIHKAINGCQFSTDTMTVSEEEYARIHEFFATLGYEILSSLPIKGQVSFYLEF